ncbi:hypothetical protein SKAU_G00342640 [Synaphobranchus kaupii]|uniref:CRAL-TRIO domain-containing protein n=1 Tax=Synaphobranchus kaupii TaxID=118154 RepID=A0A9Q1IHD8_SYNKA|nr:hypothetical protein SKAU_G00342640 [Synaphobranchus kaupii]
MDLQDEELPRALPEGAQSPDDDDDDEEEPAAGGERPAPPTSLPMPGSGRKKKKRLLAPAISLTLERSDSVFSDDYTAAALSPSPDDDDDDDTELDINLEDMDTPSDSESFGFPDSADWEGDFLRFAKTGTGGGTSRLSVTEQAEIGNMELDQVDGDGRRWRRLSISGQECYVNMSVLEPYLQVLSHGGYYGDGLNAIIVFSSCYLPENTIENYQYVMDNLFRYIVGTLELMVSENYVIVYLCGMAPRTKLPNIKWLRQCYMTIDRRLRKNLKGMFFVHPVWYIKVILTIIKPFISTKFSRKVRFIRNLQELSEYIPMEHVQIPDHIRQYDEHMDE